MKLASLIEHYETPFKAKYGSRLLPGQLHAMEAMKRCRTPDAGAVLWHCSACAESLPQPRSCGHRSCPHVRTMRPLSGWSDSRPSSCRWSTSW